jgi:hypothetical protein
VLVHGGLGNLRFAALASSASWCERSTASSLATVSPFTNNGGFSWPKVVYHVLERTAVWVHLTMYDCVSVSTYTAAKAVLGPLRDG